MSDPYTTMAAPTQTSPNASLDEISMIYQDTRTVGLQDSLNDATDSKSVAPHRSHDPATNSKVADPFQFGSRYLQEEDNVFEFNAWDHVQQDEEYKQHAESLIEKQRQAPVSDFDKRRFNTELSKWWNNFYKNNSGNFFKNRKWLRQEFPILGEVSKPDAGPILMLEVGAGNGSSAFPIVAFNENPLFKLHACDFSKKSVEVIREHESYDTKFMQADVWDVAGEELPPGISEGSVDVVLMIFIFSALSPVQWARAVGNVHRILKPGGQVLFRDYAKGDLAQVRFKKGRYMEENAYVRGDGTLTYFFEENEIANIWRGHLSRNADGSECISTERAELFTITGIAVDNRLLVNRGKQIKMYRSWVQMTCQKSSAAG